MSQSVRSRKLDLAFLIIGVLGVADMLWEHSIMRPSDGLWWTWLALVGVECIVGGLALGWAATEPKGRRMTRRERLISAGVLGIGLVTAQAAQDSLGTQVTPPFLGVVLLCFSVGFFVFTPLRARRRRERASIG